MQEPVPNVRNNVPSNVTRNMSFQTNGGSVDFIPWATSTITLPKSLNLFGDFHPLQRSVSNASQLTSLNADLSPSESHFFEVLYIGKVKISQRKVPETLIDDALTKFIEHEASKSKTNQIRRNSLLSQALTTSNEVEAKDEDDDDDDLKYAAASNYPITEPQVASTAKTSVENARKNMDNVPLSKNVSADKNVEVIKVEAQVEETVQKNENKEIKEVKTDDKNQAKNEGKNENKIEENIEMVPNQQETEPKLVNPDVPNNNLAVLNEDEDKHEDIKSITNSIKEFCRKSLLQDTPPEEEEKPMLKSNNPFLNDVVNNENGNNNMLSPKAIEKTLTEVKDLIKRQSMREDSPAPNLGFPELTPKPKVLLRSKSGFEGLDKNCMPENKPFLRDRSASIGSLNLNIPVTLALGEQNRTMLFQVGKSELRLISPDMKQILYERHFRDVVSCVLGLKSIDHFGFVCRDSVVEGYCCLVFKCESDSIAGEVIGAIKQSFSAHYELMRKKNSLSCEQCPMMWFHRLCADIEGLNEKRMHAFVMRRINELPTAERDVLVAKYHAGTNQLSNRNHVAGHNTLLMGLLRVHCENKQLRHVHDTAENRSEFINQYLGGNAIFMKAKRSLSSGFDNLLKRKSSRDDGHVLPRKNLPTFTPDSPADALWTVDPPPRVRSTAVVAPNVGMDKDNNNFLTDTSAIMGIFMKVGDSRAMYNGDEYNGQNNWRQAIFQRVRQHEELMPRNLLGMDQPAPPTGKRTKEQLRKLWRLAIDQTILLVRMEKENERIRQFAANEKNMAVRRLKLEYEDIIPVDTNVTNMWTSLFANRQSQLAKVDHHMLKQAVKQGVPRSYRGTIWYFLAEQQCIQAPPVDFKKFPFNNTPYYSLLGSLTKYQHAILIDLGRTYPQHPYFEAPLGPGQLSLYNLLKAYSLLDPEVGYCQGLSFVAGALLMHCDEHDAFDLLRHLMLRRGLREQYLPNMMALQIQLYQLARLVRDLEPDLHAKLEFLDISPALYAAPWMLTLFTSQFPLAFAVRVFDLIFLESTDVIFAVSLALLSVNKDALMKCETSEEGAEYLKAIVPRIDNIMFKKVMKKVYKLDVSRQLREYAVEFSVLRDEMPRAARLTDANRKLMDDNARLSGQIESAMDAITVYQTANARLDCQAKFFEQQLAILSKFLLAHHKAELPPELKKITQPYAKKHTFTAKISNFSSRFTSSDDHDSAKSGGASSPNLFSEVSPEDMMRAGQSDKTKTPENDRRNQFSMNKSQSAHSGLVANRPTTSDGRTENAARRPFRGIFDRTSYNSQIEQERMFEQELKHNFDENLKRSDSKLNTPVEEEDDDDQLFKNHNPTPVSVNKEPEATVAHGDVAASLPPPETRQDVCISHPLSDCDVEIKYDGQVTQLKKFQPSKNKPAEDKDEPDQK